MDHLILPFKIKITLSLKKVFTQVIRLEKVNEEVLSNFLELKARSERYVSHFRDNHIPHVQHIYDHSLAHLLTF